MKHSMLRIALALAALTAAPAHAHEYWLAPSTYHATAGEHVQVTAYVGTGFRGELKPFAATRALRFIARGATLEDLRKTSVNGDDVFGRWTATDDGGATIAYESNFVEIELAAPEFDRYLELEGLDAVRKERGNTKQSGRERYARCPKTWIAGRDAKRATTPAGLTLELVPRADPSAAGPLDLDLLYRGKPLAGALVRAWSHPLAAAMRPTEGATRDSVGPVIEGRTDAAGHVRLVLPRGGEWLVSAVHMVPSRDPRSSDWESFWASLTFARPARRP